LQEIAAFHDPSSRLREPCERTWLQELVRVWLSQLIRRHRASKHSFTLLAQ
jgi:hypothetical protein